MLACESLASVLGAIAWPLVVTGALLAFRKDLRDLLKRKIRVGPGLHLELRDEILGKSDRDVRTGEAGSRSLSHGGSQWKSKNTGNLYWLGHDIMLTVDILLRDGARDDIVYGLRQALHHAASLELAGTTAGGRLKRLKENAERSVAADWNDDKRRTYAGDLLSIRKEFGAIAESQQPDFTPEP